MPSNVDPEPEIQSETQATEAEKHPDYFDLIIEPTKFFLFRIDSVFETLNRIMLILDRSKRRANDEYKEVVERAKQEIERLNGVLNTTAHENDAATHDLHSFDTKDLARKATAFRRAREASRIVPPSLFVSMVSQFDGYFNTLSKGLFALRPEKLKGIQKTITLAELSPFSDLQELKDHLLDGEIDDVLRKSHLDQLKWLGKKFDFNIDENDPL